MTDRADQSMLSIDIAAMKTLDLQAKKDKDGGKNCCSQCFARFNKFIWRKESDLMKIDHLKPAPFVSIKFLAVVRMLISLALLG